MKDQEDDPRRRLLIKALAAGAFSTTLPRGNAWGDSFFGSRPEKLPPGQSIYHIRGEVKVNGKPASLHTHIGPNDHVSTGKNSELIFVVGGNSMLMRADSHLKMHGGTMTPKGRKVATQAPAPAPAHASPPPETHHEEHHAEHHTEHHGIGSYFVNALRLITGKLLSVSRHQTMGIHTSTATIGIRGTGVYMESNPEMTYFCNCYGVTDVTSREDPNDRTTIISTHHNDPKYILAKPLEGQFILPAPFINHTDEELMIIEALVGRSPPFVFSKSNYTAPRRDY